MITIDTKIVFIAAGMGGITGTGLAPIIARLCRQKDILVVGVVTKPFSYEGNSREKVADMGIIDLQKYIDKLYVISNDKIKALYGDSTIEKAFEKSDNLLYHCLLYTHHLLNKPVPFSAIEHFFKNGSVACDEDRLIQVGYSIAMGSDSEDLMA